MPQIAPYTGKDDPEDHVENYESLTVFNGWDDEIVLGIFANFNGACLNLVQ